MSRVRVAIRADASSVIGSGHVMRCLALADALARRGAECYFLCREHPGHLGDVVLAQGHRLHLLPVVAPDPTARGHAAWLGTDQETDASQCGLMLSSLRPDWLVVDHYALDVAWESSMRVHVGRILAIDDLADRQHDCDILLDQNFYSEPERRYAGMIPPECRLLLGPRYALLRTEFALARRRLRERDGITRRILVCFGGGDPGNLSGRALEAIRMLDRPDIAVDLVAGPLHPCQTALEAACRERPNTSFHGGTDDMASLMTRADLAIGAGGSMNWERASLGLPSIVLAVAGNQRSGVLELAEAGLVLGILDGQGTSLRELSALLLTCLSSPSLLRGMGRRGSALVDGDGAARVARRICEPGFRFRRVVDSDCIDVFRWRNHPEVRAHSLQSGSIGESVHREWFRKAQADPRRLLVIAEDDDGSAAVLRFDLGRPDGENSALVSIYLVPERLHTGIGSAILRQSLAWLHQVQPGVRRLVAEVLPTNPASLTAFREAGFTCERYVLIHEC